MLSLIDLKEQRQRFIDLMKQKFTSTNRHPHLQSIMKTYHKLPESMQLLGYTFLKELEDIHDNDNNWTRDGLSSHGNMVMNKVEHIHIKNLQDNNIQ